MGVGCGPGGCPGGIGCVIETFAFICEAHASATSEPRSFARATP